MKKRHGHRRRSRVGVMSVKGNISKNRVYGLNVSLVPNFSLPFHLEF